jgi:hypothetical protein
MKTKTKPKIKARRMWANYHPDGAIRIYGKRSTAKYLTSSLAGPIIPVAVIPLHDVEALELEALEAFLDDKGITSQSGLRAALTAIGVLPKARKGRK